MWEFFIQNNKTGETSFIFGYNLDDAFRRSPSLKEEDWVVLSSDYID